VSCFPEATYSVYVDGELQPNEQRAVERHLMTCRACRAQVLALRDEATLFSDVLHERAPAAVPRVARTRPARGLALGMLPALALTAVAAFAIGALAETYLPGSILNPIRLRGVSSMAFDLIFMLRDRAPGLLELALAVAATAGASAVLTFSLTAVFRRWAGPGLASLVCLALLSSPQPSAAHFGLHEHRDIQVAAGEIHEGTLVAWSGRTVNVDGVVDGDLIVFTERLAVRGEVRGNILGFARDLEISGTVTGSVYLCSGHTAVSGSVGRDLYAMTEDFRLSTGARVERDSFVLASTAVLEGSAGRDVLGAVDWMEVRGHVGRNVKIRGGRLALLDTARVGGDVRAELPGGQEIEVAAGAQVQGEVTSSVYSSRHGPRLERYREARFWIWIAIELVAAFLFGMLLYLLVPGIFQGQLATTGRFFRSVGVGFLALAIAPLVIAVGACTLVGLPIAVVGAFLFVTALYVSGILVAALVGTALVHPRDPGSHAFGLALLVGLTVVIVAIELPFLGAPVTVLIVLTGLGLLVERARHAWQARGAAS
jgi:anti-sigma factor RsiW